jgi:hypothetical protein
VAVKRRANAEIIKLGLSVLAVKLFELSKNMPLPFYKDASSASSTNRLILIVHNDNVSRYINRIENEAARKREKLLVAANIPEIAMTPDEMNRERLQSIAIGRIAARQIHILTKDLLVENITNIPITVSSCTRRIPLYESPNAIAPTRSLKVKNTSFPSTMVCKFGMRLSSLDAKSREYISGQSVTLT